MITKYYGPYRVEFPEYGDVLTDASVFLDGELVHKLDMFEVSIFADYLLEENLRNDVLNFAEDIRQERFFAPYTDEDIRNNLDRIVQEYKKELIFDSFDIMKKAIDNTLINEGK